MKKKRLIPVLLLKNGWLVQSKGFRRYQNLGNPITAVKRLSEWASDELVYLDITRDNVYDMRRDDIRHPNRGSLFEIIEDVSRMAFMPITVGGRVKSVNDIEQRLKVGADKVAINTQALRTPEFIDEGARQFGSQCIVISIDVKQVEGRAMVFSEGGTAATEWEAVAWARRAESEGAGEIFLNSIDRDGAKTGYDIELLDAVSSAVSIPVIACGGVGEWAHMAEALDRTKVDAVAAANIFHYTDQSVYLAKKFLADRGYNVRSPDLLPEGAR